MTEQRYRPTRASATLAPRTGEVAESAMLLSDSNVPGADVCLGVAALAAGEPATDQLAHSTSEVMFVAEGSGELITTEGTVSFTKGDAIFIPADLRHSLRNTGSTRLVSIFSFPSPNRPSDSSQPH